MARLTNTNVPDDPAPFVGRATELAALDLAFASGAPLVTLVGAPGTGKTRIARRFAAGQRDALRDLGGVWFCDLSEARDLDTMAGAVATELGLPLLHTSRDPSAQLGQALARRGSALVVLDNCEQLPSACFDVVQRWIHTAPETMFLATSQRLLGLDEEHALEIEPLPAPNPTDVAPTAVLASPAGELFVTHARRVDPSYTLTPETAPLVSAIVRRLEGVPLSIELCAARVAILGEAEILARLAQQLDLLSGQQPTARHSTLRAAIDWSWNLLAPWQQAALAQLSVFRGGFDLPAANAVIDVVSLSNAPEGPEPGERIVESLESASLLRSEGDASTSSGRRYSMLESVREFAVERLTAEADAAKCRDRHAAYFLTAGRDWANRVDGPEGVGFRHRLAREQANLTAVYEHEFEARDYSRALEALLALEPVFATRGPFGIYTTLLDAALSASDADELDPSTLARVRASRGLVAILQGRLDDGASDYTSAMAAAEAAGDLDAATLAMVKVGLCHGLAGRAADSERWFMRAHDELDQAGSARVSRTYYNDLGLVRTAQGRVEEALQCLRRALELHRTTGNRRDEGVALGNIGGRLYERGQLEEARLHFERAMEVLEEVGDRRSAGVMLAHIGQLEQEVGRFGQALEKFEKSLAIQREVGDFAWEGILLGLLGGLYLEEGRADDAVEHLRQSVVTLSGSSYRRNAGLSLAALAVAEALCGRLDAASRLRDRARQVLAEVGSPGDREACELFALAAELASEDPGQNLRGRAQSRVNHLEARQRSGNALPDEVRLPLRLLRGMLKREFLHSRPSRPTAVLVVGPRANWFAAPGSERVDLSRRGPLRRLLLALIEKRDEAPGETLTVADLAQAAWPEAGAGSRGLSARVYVGIGTLRRLGLANLILSADDGYKLDEAVPVQLTEGP